MDCTKCGTYNPEDRTTCWRCDEPLPKPRKEKKRDPRKTSQTWLYVAVAVFALITILQMCGIQMPGAPEGGGALPKRPSVAYQIAADWLT